jgi:hypothetical protein
MECVLHRQICELPSHELARMEELQFQEAVAATTPPVAALVTCGLVSFDIAAFAAAGVSLALDTFLLDTQLCRN